MRNYYRCYNCHRIFGGDSGICLTLWSKDIRYFCNKECMDKHLEAIRIKEKKHNV